jgi:hypothetical protein
VLQVLQLLPLQLVQHFFVPARPESLNAADIGMLSARAAKSANNFVMMGSMNGPPHRTKLTDWG